MKGSRQVGSPSPLMLGAILLGMAAAPVLLVVAAETHTDAAQVTVESFSFTPGTLTVAPGTTVAWVNEDETPHTVLADDKSIRSGALDTGDRFNYRFTTPGTYPYHCSLHPQMTGTVIVR